MRSMRGLVFVLGWLAAANATAVVIRDDVPDASYRLAASDFPALADLPVEGHGVLIAPQWVVTAAHAVSWQPHVDVLVINGVPREVEKVILHPGYKPLPSELVEAAMKSGDATAAMDVLAGSDDIAMVKLEAPVTDVVPARIFTASAAGKQIEIVGKGATGTGATGQSPHGANRTELRHAYSEVSASRGRWVRYAFRHGPAALPLEGSAGNGDSGGPLLVAAEQDREVVGLTSWKRVSGNPAKFQPGKYGQINYGVRLAHYLEWIDATMAADGKEPDARANGRR
jgi:hypothetical protein